MTWGAVAGTLDEAEGIPAEGTPAAGTTAGKGEAAMADLNGSFVFRLTCPERTGAGISAVMPEFWATGGAT